MADDPEQPNRLKGRESFDINSGDLVVHFFNRNTTQYPTEIGAGQFDLVPVSKQKDIMVNVARLHAKQEYDRIMELVAVLQKQAQQIKRRLDITDQVHQAEYQFQIYHGSCYWLVFDQKHQKTRLVKHGPEEYFTQAPQEYDYIARVKWLGDHSWIEVDEAGNPIW